MPAEPPSDKPLIDKLGVEPGAHVALLGIDDEGFRAALGERTAEVSETAGDGPLDLVFLQADRPEDLEGLGALEPVLERNGAVWVVHPRGSKDVPEAKVLGAGLAVGLVDNKVVRFSDTHTAHRFVIPRDRR